MNPTSPGLRILLLNMAIVLAVIGALWLLFNTDLSDMAGEYLCPSGQLGSMRLSLEKSGDSFSGDLVYGAGVTLKLLPERSTFAKDLRLVFAVPQQFTRREKYREVTLTGKYGDGTISGIVEDLGGLYPVTFSRNSVYTVFRDQHQILRSFLPWLVR